jgi:hypothetical protein
MLAVAFADGFGEQAGLTRRVVRTGRALRGVEDGIGKTARVAAKLGLEHGHRHLLREQAGEHAVLHCGGDAGEQFGVAELDAACLVSASRPRRAGQQRQPARKHLL